MPIPEILCRGFCKRFRADTDSPMGGIRSKPVLPGRRGRRPLHFLRTIGGAIVGGGALDAPAAARNGSVCFPANPKHGTLTFVGRFHDPADHVANSVTVSSNGMLFGRNPHDNRYRVGGVMTPPYDMVKKRGLPPVLGSSLVVNRCGKGVCRFRW